MNAGEVRLELASLGTLLSVGLASGAAFAQIGATTRPEQGATPAPPPAVVF